MHKRLEELSDDFLGAALWDTGKGVVLLIAYLIATVVTAFGGGAALQAGKEKLAFFLTGAVATLLVLLALAFLLARRRRSVALSKGTAPLLPLPVPPEVSPPDPPVPAVMPSLPTAVPTATALPPEPRAPAESLERLREVFAPWKQCFEIALTFLEADICCDSSNWTTEDPKQRKNGALSALIQRYVIPGCRSEYADLNRKLLTAKDPSTSEFGELVGQFKAVISSTYDTLVRWLLAGGGPLVGVDRLHRAERYALLYDRHHEAIKELGRIRSRSDLGHTAELVNELAKLLPEPIRRDPEDPFTEDPSELMRIVAWEGKSAVLGRKWAGVVEIRRIDKPGAYPNSKFTLYCVPRTTNSMKGHVSVHPVLLKEGVEDYLSPSREIVVEGTILELTEQTAVLFPANIVNIIDLPSEE